MKTIRHFIIGTGSLLICGLALALYMDMTYSTPSYFRMTTDQPSLLRSLKGYFKGYTHFNPHGLDRYQAAGSGRLNFSHFRELLQQWHHKIIVVNGRNANYFYYKDDELQQYCLKVDKDQIRTKQRNHLSKRLRCDLKQWIDGVPNTLSPKDLRSEKELLSDLGISLFSPLPDSWLTDWGYMNSLISFFESAPQDTLLYIHCGHGQGRTTTLLVMLDIFHNANEVSLQDILVRQYLLGGEDLMDTTPWENGTWTANDLKNRLNLVATFYSYMVSPDGYKAKTPWSEWLKIHPPKPQELIENLKR